MKSVMNNENKQSETVQLRHPELWRLVLGLDEEKLSYVIYSPAQENSLLMGDVPLPTGGESYLKSVENAVYDTGGLLLNDYGHVSVVVRSGRFMLLPPELGADEALAHDAYVAAMPEADGDFALCHLTKNDIDIAFEMPKGLLSFLQRTFNMPSIVHHLNPLCEHARQLNVSSETARMHVHVNAHTLDVAVFHGERLQLANSFCYSDVHDALYYVLHAWQSCNLNSREHEAVVSGNDKACRDELTAMLRKYVAYVMPGILPAAALRIGENAHLAPEELILQALCE